MNQDIPQLIDLTEINDRSGSLLFAEINKNLPFIVQRFYYIVGVPEGGQRGSHAHKILQQMVVALNGSFEIDLTDGVQNWSFQLGDVAKALYLPPGIWRTLSNFSSGAICLVLASEPYSPNDYIHDYDEFISWKAEQKVTFLQSAKANLMDTK
jgi:dTDP-4-dehydrorhamnose 3,5-epimerase-like enzyme